MKQTLACQLNRTLLQRCPVLGIALALSLVLYVGSALAAEEASADEDAAAALATTIEEVTPFRTLNYKAIHVEGIWAGLILAELAEDAPLPARIEIGVPEGTLVGWFGQMPSREGFEQASQFQMPYDMRTENGMDIYSAILTSFRYVQLELRIDEEVRTAREDGTLVMNLNYTPVHDVEELFLTAAFPAGFVSTEEDLRFMGRGPNGEQTYARSFENVDARETVSTSIEGFYVGEDTSAESTTDVTAIVIIACISVALAAGVYFFFVRGKQDEE